MQREVAEYTKGWVGNTATIIESLAVIIILVSIIYGTVRFLIRRGETGYDIYKTSLGKGLLLGLEILVAADVIRTIALEPTILNILGLGLLVLIRTFLSWSLVVEIEGRWPWQPRSGTSPVAGDQ